MEHGRFKKHCIYILQMHSVLCNKAFPPISSPVQMDLGFIHIHTSLFGSHGSISSLLPDSIANKFKFGFSLRQYEDLLHLPDAQAAFRQGFLAEVAACAGAFAWLVLGDVRGGGTVGEAARCFWQCL